MFMYNVNAKYVNIRMEPVALASNHGFSAVELNAIRQLLESNRSKIEEAWDEHCDVNR
jgi:hypothetical protein